MHTRFCDFNIYRFSIHKLKLRKKYKEDKRGGSEREREREKDRKRGKKEERE